MRIVSLNAWGGAMHDELVAWLRRSPPDVLCLQEVTRTPGETGWTTFADGERTLPQRADLFADVAGVLAGHQAWFLVCDSGPVDVAGVSRRQDFGLATFVTGDLPVVGTVAEFVHGDFTVHDEWPTSGRPRLAHGIRVADPRGGRTVAVVHLHGLRDRDGKHDTAARDRQAARLAELVERFRSDGDLIVVAGDLNLLPDSRTFAVLAEVGLTDLVGRADTRTSRYDKPVRHASYLLVSDPSAVVSFATPAEPEVSDHRPLVLDL